MSAGPLSGRRIVITRARAQASGLADRLSNLGAEVIEFPTIEIRPPTDPEPLNEAAARVAEYDWIIFTSANGVRAFMHCKPQIGAFRGRVCAIGPATRRAAEASGLRVSVVPEE